MKSRSKIFAALALPLLVVGGLGQGCYYKEAPPDTRTDAQKAEAKWFNAKAKEFQGDFDKLSPEDKQRAITFSTIRSQMPEWGSAWRRKAPPSSIPVSPAPAFTGGEAGSVPFFIRRRSPTFLKRGSKNYVANASFSLE